MATGPVHEPSYAPMMSDEAASAIKAWHEDSYRAAREQGWRTREFDFFGLSLEVPAGVMPITGLSDLLGLAILSELHKGDRVLDMGTGCGVNALLAASRGSSVVAVDINPKAIETTRVNAARNELSDQVDAKVSDVFSAVDGYFDLIVFNPPARWFPARDLMEMASTDEDYGALNRFVSNARQYLNPTGRMLILFGSVGDLSYFRDLLSRHEFSTEVVAERAVQKGGLVGEYFVFKVTDLST